MSKIFLVSDTHWNHSNIISYCARPYKNVAEMNKDLIKKWNETVSKSDIAYHLGDFAMGSKEQITQLVNQLHGIIYLVKGNHDNHSNQWYRDCGFKEVYDKPILFGEKFLLSHYPQQQIIDSNTIINVFGHIHNSEIMDTYSKSHICVCVERHGYKPVDFEEIKKFFN